VDDGWQLVQQPSYRLLRQDYMAIAASVAIVAMTDRHTRSLSLAEMSLLNGSVKLQRISRQGSGLLIASGIIGLWAVSLMVLLSLPIAKLAVWLVLPAVLWQTFLYTGLFITAHAAMHGSVYPNDLKLNHAIGTLAVFAYGLFSYRSLLNKHWLHHRHPASPHDPDFHDGQRTDPFHWYFHFMVNYWSWGRCAGLTVLFISLHHIFLFSYTNLILFWVIPSILSSVQLFVFGTFLPHRQPQGGYVQPHCAQTNPLPVFWSFIACYHFGYHQEHHEHPHIPWWQLPSIHQ
jgi:beta-carotene/zeaxanthin 4-ketolase